MLSCIDAKRTKGIPCGNARLERLDRLSMIASVATGISSGVCNYETDPVLLQFHCCSCSQSIAVAVSIGNVCYKWHNGWGVDSVSAIIILLR